MNPFPNDPDRRAIWEMLVERDIEAFFHHSPAVLREGNGGANGNANGNEPSAAPLSGPPTGGR